MKTFGIAVVAALLVLVARGNLLFQIVEIATGEVVNVIVVPDDQDPATWPTSGGTTARVQTAQNTVYSTNEQQSGPMWFGADTGQRVALPSEIRGWMATNSQIALSFSTNRWTTNAIYSNATGKPIHVTMSAVLTSTAGGSASITLQVSGVDVDFAINSGSASVSTASVSGDVPAGSTYTVIPNAVGVGTSVVPVPNGRTISVVGF